MSNRFVLSIVAVCRERGIAVEPLLRDLSVSPEAIRDPGGRLPWDDFATFLDRACATVGGREAFEDLAAEVIQSRRVLQVLAGLFVSPRQLYLQLVGMVAARMHSNVEMKIEARDDGTIRVSSVIGEGYRGSLPFFYGAQASLRCYPRLLGLPDAQVAADIEPQRAVFIVTPPASRTLTARALRALRDRAAAAWASLAGGGAADEDGVDLLFEMPAAPPDLRPVGQSLASHTDLACLVEELERLLRERFGCTHVALTVRRSDGARDLVTVPTEMPPRLSVRTLVLAGEPVGSLEVAPPVPPVAQPVFESLLPWLAVGIESCLRSASVVTHLPRSDEPQGLDRVAAAWGLTPRQKDVLRLLVDGRANKEIAAALGCSAKMVEAHVGRILHAAGVDSRAALISRFWAR